jgi:hypothetical protein
MNKYEIIKAFEKLSFWDKVWVAGCDDFIIFKDYILVPMAVIYILLAIIGFFRLPKGDDE